MKLSVMIGMSLMLAAMPLAAVNAANPCPDEPVHTYGTGGSAGGRSATASGGEDFGAGIVYVTDTNVDECDGDPNTTADWDGDLDAGVGGGAFGYGAWAEDTQCNYALNVHGPNVAVDDFVFGDEIGFVVGEDDQGGPIKVQDPVTLEWTCTTSGSITPCPDTGCDPLDPTQDPDDCLTDRFEGTGATCGTGGGDGLYWVFLDGVFVEDDTILCPPLDQWVCDFIIDGKLPCPPLPQEVCDLIENGLPVLCPPLPQPVCDLLAQIIALLEELLGGGGESSNADIVIGVRNPPTIGTITAS